MSIIEWAPDEGDYPYSSIEYLLVVTDNALAARITALSENQRIFAAGRKVAYKKPE